MNKEGVELSVYFPDIPDVPVPPFFFDEAKALDQLAEHLGRDI